MSNPAAEGLPVLAVDVGTAYTKVHLLDHVDGERRLVAVGRAPTLEDSGLPVPAAAAKQALAQVAEVAGRRELRDWETAAAATAERTLLSSLGGIARALVVCARAGPELGVVLDVLYTQSLQLLGVVSLASTDAGAATRELLRQVWELTPDALVVVASPKDAGLLQGAAEALAYGLAPSLAAAGASPSVIAVGDEQQTGLVTTLLQDAVPCRATPLPTANETGVGHTPAGAVAADGTLAAEVRRIAESRSTAWPTGWDGLGHWSSEQAVSSPGAVAAATKRLASQYDIDVLTLDLGASHSAAIVALHGRLVQAVRADLGLATGLGRVLQEAGADGIGQWLPMDVDASALAAFARAAQVRPCRVPAHVDDLLIAHAFAREASRLLLEAVGGRLAGAARAGRPPGGGQTEPVDLIVGTGSLLSYAPRAMQAALILLDAAQPEQLTQLALDRAAALALLGHLSAERATTLGQVLERDGLLNLGLCIAPVGHSREGKRAITVEVAYADRSPATVDVPYGSIEVIPLPLGERAALKLWPAREFDIGLGRGQAATPRAEVEGGAVGIIVDARGRPLRLPERGEKRQARLLQWMQSTRAYPPLTFIG